MNSNIPVCFKPGHGKFHMISVLLRVQQAFRIGDQPGFIFCAQAAVAAQKIITLLINGTIVGLFRRGESHDIIHTCMKYLTHPDQGGQTGQMFPVFIGADRLLGDT